MYVCVPRKCVFCFTEIWTSLPLRLAELICLRGFVISDLWKLRVGYSALERFLPSESLTLIRTELVGKVFVSVGDVVFQCYLF